MEFLVTGLEEIRFRVINWKPTHVISLLDKKIKTELDFRHQAAHHKSFFDDLERQHYTYAPKEEHVQKILNFTEDIPAEARVIVHCHAGISRSTATALGVMVQHGAKELDALKRLLDIRPAATPNTLILEHLDTLLGSNLKPIVESWLEISMDWWLELLNAQVSRSPQQLKLLKAKQFKHFENFRKEIETTTPKKN